MREPRKSKAPIFAMAPLGDQGSSGRTAFGALPTRQALQLPQFSLNPVKVDKKFWGSPRGDHTSAASRVQELLSTPFERTPTFP